MIFNMTLGANNNEMDNLLGLGNSYINYTTRSIPAECFISRFSPMFGVTFLQCETIGQSAFKNNEYLIEISFPNCKTIQSYAFYGCSNLGMNRVIEYTDQQQKIANSEFPTCELIQNHAFAGCNNISAIYLPMCSEIGRYAFTGCWGLSKIFLQNCLKIGEGAFSNAHLHSINLRKIVDLGPNAFRECVYLDQVYLGSELEPSQTLILSNSYIFNLTSARSEITFELYLPSTQVAQLSTSRLIMTPQYRPYSIYVPEELVSAYQTATNWTAMSSHIFALPSNFEVGGW